MNAAAERAARDAFRAERILRPGLARRALVGAVVILAAVLAGMALSACSAAMETDNTPWGKASIRTDAKPPPPIYSRSTRSTTTKPPPPAPEVEETTCENGVCGVPVR